MTDICFIALFTVFCTMGIYFFVKEITSALLKNRIKTKILLEVHNSDIDIEGSDTFDYFGKSRKRYIYKR